MLLPIMLLCSLLTGGEKVVINEFSYDDSAIDDREFVELFNPTGKAIDISGWVLESHDQVGKNKFFTIPANTTLAAGGFYVLGSSLVANVNQVVGTTNIWENSQESLILKDADQNIIDSLVYEANKGRWVAGWNPEGEGIWGNFTSIDNIETSWSRQRDGYDTNNNRDFRLQPSTPGKSNNLPVGIYIDSFDTLAVGSVLKDFGGSFAPVRVIDPTKSSRFNPGIIKASPQGKNATIFWDPAGGGNHNMLLRDVSADVLVEAWVYFDAKLRGAGEYETWSLGVQGTSGTYGNHPDPAGTRGSNASGNTGVTWSYEVTDKNATLYLVDYNDGGKGAGAKSSPKVIGKVDVKAGTTDGWQRLRLEVRGHTVTGHFGGSYGGTNGTKITGTLSAPSVGGVYVSYRERMNNNGATRPFTCDRLTIILAPFTGKVDTTVGVAKKTTKGTPRMGTNGSPFVGNQSFKLTGISLVPSGSSLWAVGINSGAPIPLSVAGGQPGSFLYITPLAVFRITADTNGDAVLPAALPNDPRLKGFKVDLQIIDIDPALTVPLKLGTSRVMSVTFG